MGIVRNLLLPVLYLAMMIGAIVRFDLTTGLGVGMLAGPLLACLAPLVCNPKTDRRRQRHKHL
jgi:hypothetical protein